MKIKFWGLNPDLTHNDAMAKVRATPSEQAVYLYLENRALKGKGPATREEILLDLGISESTLKRALGKLRRKGIIEETRRETIGVKAI